MSDYEEIEFEYKRLKDLGYSQHDALMIATGHAVEQVDFESPIDPEPSDMVHINFNDVPTINATDYATLYVDPDYDVDLADFRFQGQKVIAKKVRPVWTQWKPGTVHRDIKKAARRSRRVFKQYLKTGSLRLLKAAEKKITSWDFD